MVHNYSGQYVEQVDCVKFLCDFFRLRSDNDAKRAQYQFYSSVRRNTDEKNFTDDIIERMAVSPPAVMWPATQEEMQSAFVKLKNASSFVRPDIFGNFRKDFEGSDLSPTMLQKFLVRNFDVELNGGELYATMRVFDLNGDGMISYPEFMITFYQLGLEERSRRLLAQKNRNQVRTHAKEEKIRKRNDAFDEDLRSRIVWPVYSEDISDGEEEMEDISLPAISSKGNNNKDNSSLSSKNSRKENSSFRQSPSRLTTNTSKSSKGGGKYKTLSKEFPNISTDTLVRTYLLFFPIFIYSYFLFELNLS